MPVETAGRCRVRTVVPTWGPSPGAALCRILGAASMLITRTRFGASLVVLASLLSSGTARAATVAGGGNHTVLAKPDGTVWAWGSNSNGQLGDGTTTTRKSPQQVSALSGITAVAAGSSHTLALGSDGRVWAWGANGEGQLGDGTTTQRTQPVLLSLSGIVAIAAGTCTPWRWTARASCGRGDAIRTARSATARRRGGRRPRR
jgi:alpha-tubulin suppressor-like RCC1 family protein